MKQENKELLLKDLCARLPYRVKCKYYDCCEGDYDEGTICGFERQEYIQIDGVCIHIEEVKPYLFPISSMTEEQKVEYDEMSNLDIEYTITQIKNDSPNWTSGLNRYNWLIKNNFDVYDLIPMGLAIDATGLNVYTNSNG